MSDNFDKNCVSIGVLVNAKETQAIMWAKKLIDVLKKDLENTFPQFEWHFKIIKRHDFPQDLPLDPLIMLEFGSDLKIEYGLDFVLILTTLPLKPRFEQGVNGVPSVILESAVISLAKIIEEQNSGIAEQAALALVKHILGHLWGLDHNDNSVMRPRKFWSSGGPTDWSDREKQKIIEYLSSVADPRLEETREFVS